MVTQTTQAQAGVGPFYVSLERVLGTLWTRYSRPDRVRLDAIATARRLGVGDLAERALALGPSMP